MKLTCKQCRSAFGWARPPQGGGTPGFCSDECRRKRYLERKRKANRRLSPEYCRAASRRSRSTPEGCLKNQEKCRRWRETLRQKVVEGYGGRCAMCGEVEPAFLTLDHVHGDGGAFRAVFGHHRYELARAIREGFPPDLRLLCHNCNQGRSPHCKRGRMLPAHALSKHTQSFRRLRDDVHAGLGGVCACCGAADPLVLTVDHVKGGGTAHYKRRGVYGALIDVKRSGYDRRLYRLLCFNCNCGRARVGGVCPHESKRRAA